MTGRSSADTNEAGKVSIITGPPVKGHDFYGREKELDLAWNDKILKGISLMLSAPRRVGKTSFARKMLEKAETRGWKTLWLDLQATGKGSEIEFIRLLKKELNSERWWGKASGELRTWLDGITLDGIVTFDNDVLRNGTYEKVAQLIKNAGEILIVIDELTLYLDSLFKQEGGKEKVEFFLEWLRHLRLNPAIKARWIFCSSIGIENFASRHNLSKHFNDLDDTIKLGEFTKKEATGFLSEVDIRDGKRFEPNHITYILDEKLVWRLPYFIQLLANEIYSLIYVEEKELSEATIDEAYNRLITGNHFNTWIERLKEEYCELEGDARKILKLCAFPKEGRNKSNLLASLRKGKENVDIEKTKETLCELLRMLENDGYLEKRESRYAFRSPLLRDFWHKRFEE